MRCEIVAVGTELLLGQIVDTNSSWIGEHLAQSGIDSHFQTKVGDNLQRITTTLRTALERADAVIVCGGLGPTQDDITREGIAEVMGARLVRHDEIGERIRAMFESRGREMPKNNLRQADVPEGAAIIEQMPGTAPGLLCPVGDKVIYAVPGVPSEMRAMMEGTILPDLQLRAGVTAVIKSRVLRTWGHSESGLAEMLAERIDALEAAGNPTLAFLASGIEGLKVRITAKAADATSVEEILAAEEARLRDIMGHLVFGVDGQTMESVVLDILRKRGQSLAVAETVTGGLAGSRLTAIRGADEVLRGSLACNSGLGPLGLEPNAVPCEDLAGHMATAVADLFAADVGIASCAPDVASDEQLSGTVYFGVSIQGEVRTQPIKLPGDRRRMRDFSVIGSLNMLRRQLLERT